MPNPKGMFFAALCSVALSLNSNAAESTVQELSLRDCIDLALQHNLNLQIERRNPLQARYGITSALGGYYDPNLSVGASTGSRVSGLRLDSEGRPVAGSESDNDNFNLGLGGTLPGMGTRYSLQATTGKTLNENLLIGSSFTNAFGGASIVITQPLLKNFWMDGGRLNIALSKNSLRATELVLKRQVMNIITQVERAYYDLIFSYDNVQVQEM